VKHGKSSKGWEQGQPTRGATRTQQRSGEAQRLRVGVGSRANLTHQGRWWIQELISWDRGHHSKLNWPNLLGEELTKQSCSRRATQLPIGENNNLAVLPHLTIPTNLVDRTHNILTSQSSGETTLELPLVESPHTYQYSHWMSVSSTLPSKDTDWQTGLKRMIWQSVVYKRPILLSEINTGLGWKAGRISTKSIATQNSRSSNTYIRQSRLQTYIGQTWQRRTLHTNKRGNTTKRNNNYQPVCIQYQCNQFHQTSKDLKVHINSNTG
jgi:hypothetical protein